MDPLIGDQLLRHDLGRGQRLLGGGAVARLPEKDVVRMLPRSVRAVHLVLDVLAQHRRVRVHRLERIDQRRQILVVDVDQLDRVGRGIAVGRDHEGDLLVLEQHLLVGQDRLHVAGERRHVVQIERLEVGGGQDRLDARHLERRLLVDPLDPRMAVRRADEVAEQHAGQLDVVDIVALALGEAGVLDPLPGAAQAFQLRAALARARNRGVHSAASRCAFSWSAAARTALTMF